MNPTPPIEQKNDNQTLGEVNNSAQPFPFGIQKKIKFSLVFSIIATALYAILLIIITFMILTAPVFAILSPISFILWLFLLVLLFLPAFTFLSLKKNYSNIKFGLIILLTIIPLLILFYIFHATFGGLVVDPVNVEVPQIPQLRDASNESSAIDWKTYRNDEYGFEVGYPENWKEEDNREDNATHIIIFSSPDYSKSAEPKSFIAQGRAISIRIFKYRIRESLQELKDEIISTHNLVDVKVTNLKMVGSDRILYDFAYKGTKGHAAHILANSIEIELGVLGGPSETESGNREIFNKMVSTFKFTNLKQENE